MRVTITDRLGFTSTTRTYLDNGFLKVSGNAARTGTQDYLAGELGLDGAARFGAEGEGLQFAFELGDDLLGHP